jgi:hypothetical protein
VGFPYLLISVAHDGIRDLRVRLLSRFRAIAPVIQAMGKQDPHSAKESVRSSAVDDLKITCHVAP